jgi:hypothetical protein
MWWPLLVAANARKECVMGDQNPQPRQPETQPGGGTSTTDPTFANQSKSLPKENKPDKVRDIKNPKR